MIYAFLFSVVATVACFVPVLFPAIDQIKRVEGEDIDEENDNENFRKYLNSFPL